VRTKLASLIRARWLDPPFGGPAFTNLLLDAFAAMAEQDCGGPLLPDYQPLDLFVTVTDFHGHPERLRVFSPSEVVEMEHRLILSFRDPGGRDRKLAEAPELAFAARATASFPGAFPPFTVKEMDKVLEKRGDAWPGRNSFLRRALPRQSAIGDPEHAVLIDGGVLANAPFRPAIGALQNRPARRAVDRRFVYIDPNPARSDNKVKVEGEAPMPGFFATIFGAVSNIPREQPIRENLEAIEQRSARIRQLQRIVESMRPEVEAAIERVFGHTFFLADPNPKRLASWRTQSQFAAAKDAGYAYAAYGHLKIATVVEEVVRMVYTLGSGTEGGGGLKRQRVRRAIWLEVNRSGISAADAISAKGARADVIDFLRRFDMGFHVRRLSFVARDVAAAHDRLEAPVEVTEAAAQSLYDMVRRFRDRALPGSADEAAVAAFANAEQEPVAALDALARTLDLRSLGVEADDRLIEVLRTLPRGDRRRLMLSYLGYPFYDVATLPLLQGEGLDEFDPVKVDRISPDDARAIREGGAEATLKGIQFHNFGAFFSRAYRENDYLWGRLHGADRLIDIVVSTLPEGEHLEPGEVTMLKREAFRAILHEEKGRLTCIDALFETLDKEIG
jgi:patatin-related protein